METPQENFFLGRQPILDRNQEIVGFELLFRSADIDHADFESYSHASASVITNALSTFGIHELLGGKFGFINIHLNLLLSEVLELLPLEHTVLELLEVIELDQEVVERCRELKKLGFQLALDDHIYNPDHVEIYKIVDIVKIDILQTDAAQLPTIVKELRRWPVKILAEKVETVEQFQNCFSMGFDLFQGYFFARPVVLNKRRIDVSGIAMLKLLQQLSVEASFTEIEQTFKENPGLSYNLLRLVNSVALGIREKIKTLRHAIVILGMNHLRRWVQLSLFAGNDTRGINNPLLEMAAVRGILMELLVVQKGLSNEQAEEAFMTGILSLLDVLFEMEMSEIVQSLNLTDDVSNALLDRQGQLGCLLNLVERIELTDFDAVKPLLSQCGITLDQLFSAQLEAFNWRATIMED
ncbi:EAL and HDOD domain-containing protein [Pelotalea chapellei]|uniref:HDOD domain-containing protein n=1 Tax=Pelotalea chapellei TaxID=44671 RepID=A0ABS5U804_9BACT|nr:HDOD domain-containing protein [Pelotalea chapellei]MBT1071779.1 HDOD domain-containing protein [Pelotalea chapellei]